MTLKPQAGRLAAPAAIAIVAALTMLSACDRGGGTGADNKVMQTGFPGQVSAGGGTSGDVMARAGTASQGAPAGQPRQATQEGERGQAPGGQGVSGTPGIPEGSGGTTSGAGMGGTTPGAASSRAAPPPGGATPTLPPGPGNKSGDRP